MSRIIYVNGRYQPYYKAYIHAEDRGFVFADAAYEVCEVFGGQLVDSERHLKRLQRSLGEMMLKIEHSPHALLMIMKEIVRRNRVQDGALYLQISRGMAKRNFIFPPPETTKPTIVCWARSQSRTIGNEKALKGIRVKTVPDMRWQRVDIKTVGLLASVLARQEAFEQGAEEAWLYDTYRCITEGAASNAWIIDQSDHLITHPATQHILKGVTRDVVFDICQKLDLSIVERKFTIDEAYEAKEAFITAATALIMPVIQIDDYQIGKGKPGQKTLKLRDLFHHFAIVEA